MNLKDVQHIRDPDLNIDNYDFPEILNLFQLSVNFNDADLKRAKRKVLSLHPDKSRLDPKYFLFYSKAYKVLYSIFEFNNRSTKKSTNTDTYIPLDTEEENKRTALTNFFDNNKELKNTSSFNEWFNKEFEKQKAENENEHSGYGEWLKSNDDTMDTANIRSLSDMNEEVNKRKTQVRSMIVHQDINEFNSGNMGTMLGSDTNSNYSSGMFGSVQYQDLKQAHVESVIPVTDEDYANVKKFKDVTEYNIYRTSQDTRPLTEQQALQYLANKEKQEETLSSKRAFELAKQTEEANARNQQFWAGIMKIKNSHE